MSKYYKIFLDCESFCVVGKKVPFTKNLYREIITDKIIYPKTDKTSAKLTYGYLPNGQPRCYEITNHEAKAWLLKLKSEDYIYDLERIEYIRRYSHKIEIDEKKVYKNMEKQADKSVKRTLRKIKRN
ncbi:MAG: hypothetical protein IJB48_07740 [Clostridia bacterium]|nr:hypothetical protein [Clostridia bacterium]